MRAPVVPLADLPLAWWGFWLIAGAAVFFVLAWTLTRLATGRDEREGDVRAEGGREGAGRTAPEHETSGDERRTQ